MPVNGTAVRAVPFYPARDKLMAALCDYTQHSTAYRTAKTSNTITAS